MAEDKPSNLDSSLPERSDERPWPDAIRAQLNRILVQPHFVGADDEVRLLQHLIEASRHSLNQDMSDMAIANRLFRDGRNESEALIHLRNTYNELQKEIESYFASRGRNDPVIFELSKEIIGLTIKASDVQLELEEIDADAEASATLPPNKPVNLHAIIATGIMTLASIIYFFGIDRLTTGPTGPESITDVGPANQKLISLAVIPFSNDSPRTLPSHYAKAVSIELAARLGRIKSLRIIAPATIQTLTKTQTSLTDIAEITDVRYVLTGKFTQAINKNQLSITLHSAEGDSSVWQRTYPHNLEAMPSLYGDISQTISNNLFTQKERRSQNLQRDHPDDRIVIQNNTYSTYLKARSALTSGTPQALAQSITLFRSAVHEGPKLARAHSGLAASLARLAGYGLERIAPQQNMKESRKAAANALRINEYFAEPYTYLGEYRTTIEWNWKNAEQVYAYAIQFNPSDADARLYYSRFLESQGRHRDAIDQAERAHILNPLSPIAHANRAWQYLQAGWTTRARKHFNAIRKLYPKFWGGSWGLGHYYWQKEDLDDAVGLFETAASLDPKNTFVQASLGHIYGQTKQEGKARKILARLLKISQSRYVSPMHIAMVHAGLKNFKQAFHWLEKAFLIKAHGLAWVNVTKEFHPLRNDTRFHNLLQRLKLKRPTRKRRLLSK